MLVDGKRATLGQPVTGHEKILLDGKPIAFGPPKGRPQAHAHIVYYKPAGEVTSRSDPEGRRTVFDTLPQPPHGRWINVGRLDLSTSGLLLLTTDGELAHRLTHPRYEIAREYAVRLLGAPTEEQMLKLTEGVELEDVDAGAAGIERPDGTARFDTAELRGGAGANVWVHVTLVEKGNREVRRIFEALGLTVSRIIRVRYGPIDLGKLRRGTTRELEPNEAASLYKAVGLDAPRGAPRRATVRKPKAGGARGRGQRSST